VKGRILKACTKMDKIERMGFSVTYGEINIKLVGIIQY
jgi:hypothetical protein